MDNVVRYSPATIQPMENKAFIGMAIDAEGEYVLHTDYTELEIRYLALVQANQNEDDK